MDRHRKGYWKKRSQLLHVKKYQRDYHRKYRKTHPPTPDQRKNYNQKKKMRMREKKKRLVEMFGGKCNKCGYNKCIGALDFHHINRNKKDLNFGVNEIPFERMIKEAKKCIVLCANCHREEHYKND